MQEAVSLDGSKSQATGKFLLQAEGVSKSPFHSFNLPVPSLAQSSGNGDQGKEMKPEVDGKWQVQSMISTM